MTIQHYLKGASLASLSQLVNGQALIAAYADANAVIGIIALVSIPLAAIMRKPKKQSGPAEVGG